MADLIQLRRDTKANWDAVSGSVILADGEVGIICDQTPLQCKVGDGVSYWNQLETQAWVGTGSLDQVSSSIAELSGSLEEGLSSLEANVSYVVCQTSGSVATKDISVPDFELSTHCRLVVKMEHAHTSSTAPTLRINLQNGTEKALYYDGVAASSTNTWSDNEVLDVYYDGQHYQCVASGGGKFKSGQKVKDVAIKDENGEEVTGPAGVLSAEAGASINDAVNDIYHRSVTPASETVIFNGTSGYATFDAVTLSQEGDYLEVEVKTASTLSPANGGFAFLTNDSSYQAVSIANYLISVKNSSHNWLSGMNGANGQLSISPSVLSSAVNKIKFAWETTGFVVYLNDVAIHTISGALPTVAFNGIGRYLSSGTYQYWHGELHSFKVKAGNTEVGKLSSLTNFDNQGLTINEGQEVIEESGKLIDVKEELQQEIASNSAVFHSGQSVGGVGIVNNLESGGANNVLSAEMGKELNQKIEGELGVRTLNSLVIAEGGEISFDEITLSEDGDSLEFNVITSVLGNQIYKARAFAGHGDSLYSIVLHAYILGLVSGTSTNVPITNFNGGNGQYNFGSIVNISTTRATFKIAFENSAINLYINGTLRQSSTDVKTIRINRIGGPYTNSGTTYHWAGTLYSFNYTHAGVTKSIIDLNGYQVNNLVTENITQEVLGDGLEQRVSLLEKVATEKGKKIGWFGDSLSMLGSLPHIVGDLLGADVYDFSISGASATKTACGENQTNVTVQALIEQKIDGDLSDARTDIENQSLTPSIEAAKLANITNLENTNFGELDKIVIFAGTNDLSKQYLTIENFKTGLRAIFTTLLGEWPRLQIVWISPAWRSDANTTHPNGFVLQDICDAIEDVCKEYSVPFMDFYHQCMVNSVNALTYMTNENPIIHPNNAGDKMWAMKIARYIASK